MKDSLLDKRKSEDQSNDNYENIRHINYSIIFLVVLACGYSVLFITMALNIYSMNNNLFKIIDVMDVIKSFQVNMTTAEALRNDLDLIKDCVIHKYCKRVPD